MMLMTPLSHHNSYGNSVCGCQYCTLYIELERPKPSFSIPASPSGNYDDNISTPPRPPFVTSPHVHHHHALPRCHVVVAFHLIYDSTRAPHLAHSPSLPFNFPPTLSPSFLDPTTLSLPEGRSS
jgi:hypothetical protein